MDFSKVFRNFFCASHNHFCHPRLEQRDRRDNAGFKQIEISMVAAEEQPPHFQTILAGGEK